jgi:hypothetical protein
MLTKKNLLAYLFATTLLFSCNKNATDVPQDTLQVNGEKQKAVIEFSNYTFEQRSGIALTGDALGATTAGATAISPKIALNSFKTAAPFIAVYGAINGQQLEKENIKIEFIGSADGTQWEKWITVAPNYDVEASSTRLTFNNVELDKATRYVKFRVTYLNTKSQLNKANFYFFNPQVTSSEEQAKIDAIAKQVKEEMAYLEGSPSTQAAAAAINPALCAKPSFTARSSWGARAATSSPSYTTVNFIIVHHEEGSNSSTDWAARVRAVQNLHMDVNGWADIAYNYLVDPNGVPYEGRGGGENVIGAHLCAKNTNTMGICMLGSYTSVLPTNNALYALKRILAWKCVQRNLNPEATGFHVDRTIHRVSGHRASCSTDCPGTTLFNYLPTLRSDVNVNFIAKCK